MLEMMLFEMCPSCNMLRSDRMKSMILSGDDREMQCDVCNKSFKLPDCEAVRKTARKQRSKRYGE